jgi:hypothetical protein
VLRTRETRLARLAAVATRVELAEAARRRTLRARAAVCALIRHRLTQSGVDPVGAPVLRIGEAAAAELASLAKTPGMHRAERALADHGGHTAERAFEAKLLGIAQRYPHWGAPDFTADLAKASLAELLAWCMARPADDEAGV